jgi:tetratricopeptide (TPR) repeat protein
MKSLLEISELVTAFITGDALKILFREKGADKKSLLFLEGLLQKRWQNDELAAAELYKAKANDKRYQMLKSRTRKRLLDLIFTLDVSSKIKTSYYRELIKCYRLLFAANQLFVLGKVSLAFELFKKAESVADKYQFSSLQMLALQRMRELYGYMGNMKDFDKATAELLELAEVNQNEITMDSADFQFRILVRGILGKTSTMKFDPEMSIKKVKSVFQNAKRKSHRMYAAYHRSLIYYYHLKKDHKSVLKQCLEFEHYLLRGQKFTDMALVAEVALQKLDTCIFLRDFKTGKLSAIQCDGIYTKGNANRLIYQQYFFLLSLHTGRTEEAIRVFQEVIGDPSFKKYPEERIERWRIFEAMLNYISPEGKLRKFNIHKFLNEVPTLSHDKAGFNLSIIIAQFCLLIKRGEFDRVMDKFDSLKSYLSRYIRLKENPRGYYFIKLLLMLIKSDFDVMKCRSAGKKYLDLINVESSTGQKVLDTMEIIPYDHLWLSILENTEKQQQAVQSVKKK